MFKMARAKVISNRFIAFKALIGKLKTKTSEKISNENYEIALKQNSLNAFSPKICFQGNHCNIMAKKRR